MNEPGSVPDLLTNGGRERTQVDTRTMGAASSASGAVFAIGAYGLWGVLPAYWKLLGAVPALEILANRVLWSFAFTLALITGLGRAGEIRTALRSPRERVGLAASGALIAINWGVFIWAVNAGRIVEASLGYYLNPLLNAALGRAVFREQLRPAQGAAIALAALGVGALVISQGGLPWISLALAGSFALYGLAHKLTTVRSIPSLALETAALSPLALAWLLIGPAVPGGALAAAPAVERALLVAAGPITALPLLWFASAAQRLSFTTLGLFQYLAPTLSLLLAVLVYDEAFTRAHAFAFGCIWSALALYTTSAWRGSRSA